MLFAECLGEQLACLNDAVEKVRKKKFSWLKVWTREFVACQYLSSGCIYDAGKDLVAGDAKSFYM